jgi:DNA mismatch repair protein MutL
MALKIKVLDEKVISQIAAGEVIERPASVVKELLENAIDADASRITIKIEDGGKKSIKVVDNGIGMTKENAKRAFHRHSTSKITNLRDLESISSLGFRGEALASIAAISKVTLITKSKDESEVSGCEILIEGGKEKHVKEVAANEGTTLMVSDIFYNTPARRKYLKTQRAELAKITDLVTRFALIHYKISFKLIHNGSEIINAPSVKTPLDNITYIYGKEIAKELMEINYSDQDIEIKGFISKPAVTRKSSSHISFFVNNRYITSKLLTSALREGYKNLIMKKRFPIAVISLNINPRKIDVNVHPTKLEIKFEDEKQVFDALKNAVESTFKTGSLIPDMGEVTLESPQMKAFDVHELDRMQDMEDIIPFVVSKNQVDILKFAPSSHKKRKVKLPKRKKIDKIPKMSLIGQILNTYIVAQSDNSILIIDQHAAHERVVFEKLMKYQENENHIQQELLTPLTLDLTPEQKTFITDKKELLSLLGFNIEHFGGDTFQVRTMPAELRETDSKSTVYDIIDELIIMGRSNSKTELKEKALAVVACHSAIRGGEELSNSQMKDLIQSLYLTKNVTSCPHGRPSILSMSRSDLEKKFKRK